MCPAHFICISVAQSRQKKALAPHHQAEDSSRRKEPKNMKREETPPETAREKNVGLSEIHQRENIATRSTPLLSLTYKGTEAGKKSVC